MDSKTFARSGEEAARLGIAAGVARGDPRFERAGGSVSKQDPERH